MAFKLFGAALDALDDPERVDLKRAYIEADASGRLPAEIPKDPYDVIAPHVADRCGDHVALGGKLELPGWLTPRPPLDCTHRILPELYSEFILEDGVKEYVDACACFVERFILPDTPCMLAVDHGMTAGPLRALARCEDPRETTVVVIDSHFDAVPSQYRSLQGAEAPFCGQRNCGSFLSALLQEEAVLPENLFVVGVSDFPVEGTTKAYQEAYRFFLECGVTVVTRDEAEEPGFSDELERRLVRTHGKRLYVSLDADAGACQCMNAVRFLNTVGLREETILGFARLFKKLIETGRFRLAGMDVAEVDVHLLGIDDEGTPDRTSQVCADFITTLMRKEV